MEEIKKSKTTQKKTTDICKTDKTMAQKKDGENETKSKEKERKNSDMRTARSFKTR